MKRTPWWERFPGRLEQELQALSDSGTAWERDEVAFRSGRLRLVLSAQFDQEQVRLLAVFPEQYPYFRFEVYAPDLDLPHHQNPFVKNLCLIGRDTENWRTDDLLARFISEQLPRVLLAGRGDSPSTDEGLEERQGEPFSGYLPYPRNAMVLIDGAWAIDPAAPGGKLVIGVEERTSSRLLGWVLEVNSPKGERLAVAHPNLVKRLQGKPRIFGEWVRLSAPVRSHEAEKWLNETRAAVLALGSMIGPSSQRNKGEKVEVLAAVFPEELAWRQQSDGWVFILTHSLLSGGRMHKQTTFIRTGRAGPLDLAARIPTLSPLRDKRVAIFGLGALGAPSALELARCGIGELRLLDSDFVDPGPAVRWPVGLRASGRDKVATIGELIADHYPYTKVIERVHRIGAVSEANGGLGDSEVLDEMLNGIDLVYDATAEIGTQRLLADLSKERGVSYVGVSSTLGAWGGQVLKVRPTVTKGCWRCFQWAQSDGTILFPPADQSGKVQPSGCADPTFTGAGFDLAETSAAGVRAAVGMLCSGIAGGYPDGTWDVAILSLRDIQGNPIPPSWQIYTLQQHPKCECSK